MKWFDNTKALGKNKYELYLSFLVVALALQYRAHLPHDLNDDGVFTVALLIAFFCALNAVRDIGRMNWFERIIAILWFGVLLFSAPMAVWGLAHNDGIYADC